MAKFFAQSVHQNFQTPLSLVASDKLQLLADQVQNIDSRQDENDCWTYIWGSGIYASKKAYEVLKGTTPVSHVFKWMSQSCALGKHKFFFWLLLRDRLNTRNRLRRKNKELPDYSCAMSAECSGNFDAFVLQLSF